MNAGDDFGSGSETLDPIDSPHVLTPSTSADSLDVDELLRDDIDSDSSATSQSTKVHSVQPIEILREVKTLLQCLQSDNKNSQVALMFIQHVYV